MRGGRLDHLAHVGTMNRSSYDTGLQRAVLALNQAALIKSAGPEQKDWNGHDSWVVVVEIEPCVHCSEVLMTEDRRLAIKPNSLLHLYWTCVCASDGPSPLQVVGLPL